VTALRRVCIKTLPNTLIIVLRRFEFNYDTMRRKKINDYIEFPFEIDMEPYTQEGIEAKERQEADSFEEQPAVKKYPESYYNYKLKGVVIHMGTADSGHYYSLIKNRDLPGDVWNEFNDCIVRPFDIADMPSEAFGGEEKFASYNYAGSGGIISSLREKYRNAYLLFYERDNFYDVSKPELEQLE
jgi:ubiquitin carboxyl-terminal hydrolase 9/24